MMHTGFTTAIDDLIYRISIYGVPALIALVSVIAIGSWDDRYQVPTGAPVQFKVLEQQSPTLSAAAALAALGDKSPVSYVDTRLSNAPFWLSFDVPMPASEATKIEFPSRHATSLSCWNAMDLQPLGEAGRATTNGRLRAGKAGFVLDLLGEPRPATVLCRAAFAGPARITALAWSEQAFGDSLSQFTRNSGLLDGGLLVLSLFVLMTAVINKEWLYVLFAAWLVANLRLAALSSGWDTQWLGYTVPPDWLLPVRKISMALYYLLTITLFGQLFRDDLQLVRYKGLFRANQWSCLPLLVAAVFLTYGRFLPVLWALTVFNIGVLSFFILRIMLVTRSRVAMWYAASLAIALFASLYEVIAAAVGMKLLIGTLNSVTAALAGSLMAALAIAEQMRQERQRNADLQTELQSKCLVTPVGLFTLDLDGRLLFGNPALGEILGVSPDFHVHAKWQDYFGNEGWLTVRTLACAGMANDLEVQSIAQEGRATKWFLVRAILANNKIEGSLQDVTERTEATKQLGFLAHNDPLTGVMNRRGIERVLNEAIAELREGESVGLAYLDLDRFKLINDLFGHVAGDEILKQVCRRVEELLRGGQDIGRVGGDEFLIVFRRTPIHSAAWTCRGIIEHIGTVPYQIGNRAFQVRGSIGLVEMVADSTIKDAISVADRACRHAKAGHDGNLVIYEKTAPIFSQRAEELRLIERLGADAAPDGLFLVMQPIMSMHAPYASLNVEVLLRMREANGSITPAPKIISAAESNGRIAVIDKWVLRNTLDWLGTHRESLKNTRFACVNLSGGSLNDENFIEDAFAILRDHGKIAEQLCIEITESVALHDLANTRRFIDGVRNFGAKIALDDFGAGYTSFSYMKELRADAVKIDGAFVKGVNSHPVNLAIVAAIVDLARNLGMTSIAEWAEDKATIEALAEVGVDYVQGYGIARPMAPEKILVASSSASFIEDPSISHFVRNALAKGHTADMWDQIDERTVASMH